MRNFICGVIICVMLVTILSGCSLFEKIGLKKADNDELRPVSSIVMNENEAKKLSDKVPVRLYFTNNDNSKLLLEIRYIPMSEAKKSVNNLASAIVKELIKGPMEDTGLKATIPKDTQLRSPVVIDAGIATVDLTKDFVSNHPGGKEAEQITIYSIVNSLTELKEIQKVRFTIDGKEMKEFKGNFRFDTPFPRSNSLISKDPPVRSTLSDDVSENNPDDGEKKNGDAPKTNETFDENEQYFEEFEDALNNMEEFNETSEETYIEILE